MKLLQILIQVGNRFVHQRNATDLVPFAMQIHTRCLYFQIEILKLKIQKFLDACTGVIKHNHDESVAHAFWCLIIRLCYQCFEGRLGQIPDFSLRFFACRHLFDSQVHSHESKVLNSGVIQKRLQGGEPKITCAGTAFSLIAKPIKKRMNTAMLIFLQSIFVSFVILHLSNIWVALIPKPSLMIIVIGAYIYLFSILLRRLYIIKYLAHIVIVLIVSSLVMIATHIIIERSATSIIGYWLVTCICVVILSLWRKRQEMYAIKVFIILCTIISLLGIIAWLIVNFNYLFQGYIDPAHVIDLEEFTGGRMERGFGNTTNVFGIGMNSYSFPYSLGLVLTGSYAYELFGIPFFRASGIFHEPVTAAFMIIPALVLTYNSTYFPKWQRRIFLTIQFCFLAASMSLSIIISLLSVFILYNILVLPKKNLSWVNIKKVFCFAVIISVIGLLGVYSFNIPGIRGITRNILFSKVTTGDYLSILLGVIFNPKYFFTYIYFLTASLSCAFIAAKKNNNSLMSFSLIIICFLIISLKVYFYNILVNPGFFILFSLMLKNLGKSARSSHGHQLALS